MSQTEKSNQRKVQLTGLKLAMSAVGMGLSFLIDIFVMTGAGQMDMTVKFIVIGIVSLVFLLCTYLFMNAGLRLYNMKLERQEEMYDDLFKSSKATYLLMRKAFQEIDDTLSTMEEKVGIPVDELMEAQKSVAKVTISRNKENADALMNSNDKLLDKIFEFESMLESLEDNVLSKQKDMMDSSIREIGMKQQELSSMIKDLEIELRKEMSAMSRQVAQPMVMPQMDMPVMPQSETNEITDDDLERMIASSEDATFPDLEEDVSADVISFEAPEEDSIDALSFETSEVAYEDEVLPGFEESTAEELMEDDVLAGLDDLLADDFATTENVADESVEEMIPNILEELNEEISIDFGEEEQEELIPELVEEPIEEEKPPMPDLSDPNKVMSPEDIAALIANL